MAAVMLATYPEIFAGGAIIAGLPYGIAANVQEALEGMFQGKSLAASAWGDHVRRASPHNGRWPRVSIWHGDADSTVLPLNARELEKQWIAVHSLPLAPSEREIVDGHTRRIWRGVDGEVLVESYTIAGLAHGAPIAAGTGRENCGIAGPFVLEAGISSSARIASFWGIASGSEEPSSAAAPRSSLSPATLPAAKHAVALETPHANLRASSGSGSHEPAQRAAQPVTRGAALDPHHVIARALRSAGLLRR
jgi:feruloyl esterase